MPAQFARRHYEIMAKVIRAMDLGQLSHFSASAQDLCLHPDDVDDLRAALAKDLGKVFQQDNPNFNMERWILACT